MDFDTLKQVLAALERHGVRYVIFGAAALNVRTVWRDSPRTSTSSSHPTATMSSI